MTITLKLQYKEDIRRLTLDSKPSYSSLLQLVANMFQLDKFQLRYKDSDGDMCSITSDLELQEAISHTLSLLLSEQSTSASVSMASRNMVRLFVYDSERDPFASISSPHGSGLPTLTPTPVVPTTPTPTPVVPTPTPTTPTPTPTPTPNTSAPRSTIDIAALLSSLTQNGGTTANNLGPLLASLSTVVPGAIQANAPELTSMVSQVMSSIARAQQQQQQQPPPASSQLGSNSAATYFQSWNPDDTPLIPTPATSVPPTIPITTPENTFSSVDPKPTPITSLPNVSIPTVDTPPVDYPIPGGLNSNTLNPAISLVSYEQPAPNPTPTPILTPTPTPTPVVPTPTITTDLPQPVVPGKPMNAKYMARFVRDITLTDGSLVPANSTFVKTWRMRNDGTIAWPAGTELRWVSGHQFTGDTIVPVAPAEPGQEIDIVAKLQAPATGGRCVGYFRLATPDNTQFGHRVWVDVVVSDTPAPTPILNPTPNPTPNPIYPTFPPQPQIPVHTEPKIVPYTTTPTPPVVPQPPAFVVPSHLIAQVSALHEMGFTDDELLVGLLERNGSDLQATMDQLLGLSR